MRRARLDRLLVVKLGDLGDCILATPALRAIRTALPFSRIDLLAGAAAVPLVRTGTLVDNHLRLSRPALEGAVRGGPRGLVLLGAFAGALRRRQYDGVVLLEHLTTGPGVMKLAGLALASGAPRRFGLDNGRGWFLTDAASDEGFCGRHEADYWLSVAALLGADASPRPTELPIGVADAIAVETLLNGLPRPIVALHPGSGGYSTARRWPVDRFAAVGRALVRERGGSLVVVGNETALNAALSAATGARDLTGRTSIAELAALLARVELLITNDSGVLHVGVAANAPLVAIFGQTDPRAWGPYYGDASRQARAEVVQVALACRPCLYRRHELGWRDGCVTRECLDRVSTEMVLAAARRQLERWRPAVEAPAEAATG